MLELRIRKQLDSFRLDLAARTSARVLGVLGPSGSGKTTLLNCLAGVIAPDEGAVIVDGTTWFDSTRPRAEIPANRRGIGYVFQSALLFPHLSLEGNLRYGEGVHGEGPAFSDVVRVLELTTLLNRRTDSLSGGEARRAALGRALLSAPKLLLLDEPLTGLDRRLAHITLGFLHRAITQFRLPVVYVSHALTDVLFLCDEAWVLQSGRLVEQGPPRALVHRLGLLEEQGLPALENLFTADVEQRKEDITTFRIGGQCLHVDARFPPGRTRAMLSIHASQIMIARVRPERISARNILRGRVVRLESTGSGELAFVDVGVEWMVTLTRRAVAELELHPGVEVFAILKASAIDVTPLPISD